MQVVVVISFEKMSEENVQVFSCHWKLVSMLRLQAIFRGKYDSDVL